jgi:uncharacterized protein
VPTLSEFRDELNGPAVFRNEAPKILYSSWRQGLITNEILRDVIRGVWTSSEFPLYYLDDRDWVAMFQATGFVSGGTRQPTEPLTAYRGAILSTNGLGMAWTLALEVARQYAENLGLSGFAAGVFEATVPPDAVLAIVGEMGRVDGIGEGGEAEIIVNPDCLCGESAPRLVDGERIEQAFKESLDGWMVGMISSPEGMFPNPGADSLHGQNHWRRVASVGLDLAHATPGADVRVVLLFALLHDSQRENEDDDPGHGERAAQLARELHAEGILDLGAGQLDKLVLACRTHTDGTRSTDPTVGVCFDADRLDLGRVGIEPDPELMSTNAGRERASRMRREGREWLAPLTSPVGTT